MRVIPKNHTGYVYGTWCKRGESFTGFMQFDAGVQRGVYVPVRGASLGKIHREIRSGQFHNIQVVAI